MQLALSLHKGFPGDTNMTNTTNTTNTMTTTTNTTGYQLLSTDHAPKAIGPYSQAVGWNGLVFLSGQIPLDPATGQLVEGGIAEVPRPD